MVATFQWLIFRAEAMLSLKVVEGFNTRFDLEIFLRPVKKQQYNKGLLPLSYEELLQVSEKTLTLTENVGEVPTVSKGRPKESRLGPGILKACFWKEETVAEL